MKYEAWELPRIFAEAHKEWQEKWGREGLLPEPHYGHAMCVCERVIKKYIERENNK